MTGESPSRPGTLKKRPEVVVVPTISPLAVTASQLIVPCGRKSEVPYFSMYQRMSGSFSSSSPRSIQSSCVESFSFQYIQIFRERSVSRFSSGKPWAFANLSAPSPTRKTRFVRSITSRATFDGFLMFSRAPTAPALHRRAVHDRGVELPAPFLVGDPAVADGDVVGVVLDDVDAGNDRVERISARGQDRVGLADGLEPVVRGDDDGPRALPCRR